MNPIPRRGWRETYVAKALSRRCWNKALRVVQRFMKARTVIRGIGHQRVPEYPLAALREALVNAVAHRDYSRYAVGTQVQVRFFPNRVEIQNPGGLYGPVTVDLLGELGIQSTRNAALARLLEDLGLMENRGTGLAAMAAAVRAAHLPPPLFQDGRTYFRVTLCNESLLTEDVLAWLAGFQVTPPATQLPPGRYSRATAS